MSATEMRKYVKILEGELIPQRRHTLRIEVDDYNVYRTLLHMPSPENFTTANKFGKVGMFTFWDALSYDETKRKLEKMGIKYSEEPEGTTTFWDQELTSETEHTMSPYPSNTGIYDHEDGAGTSRPSRNLRARKQTAPISKLPQHVPTLKSPDVELNSTRKTTSKERW